MAELATIARPYAEALFEAAGDGAATLTAEVRALADVAADPALRQFADNPKVGADEVFDLITAVARPAGTEALSAAAQNFLRTVIDNGRLAVLPAIARQFQQLVNRHSGVWDAIVYSAFEMTPQQVSDATAALEKRFGRKLKVQVVVEPELIGGIRVVVGDEVLDTSVRARLQQMKVALTA